LNNIYWNHVTFW